MLRLAGGLLRLATAYWRWLDIAPAARKAANEVGSMSSPIGQHKRVVGSPAMVETAARRLGLDKVNGEEGEKEGTWALVAHRR